MRSLTKDKQTIFIAEKLPSKPIIDENGNPTGEYAKAYGEPRKLFLNVAEISDIAEIQAFGENAENTLRINHTLWDSNGYEIKKLSAMWLNVQPNETLTDENFEAPMNNNFFVIKTINLQRQKVAFIQKVAGENAD